MLVNLFDEERNLFIVLLKDSLSKLPPLQIHLLLARIAIILWGLPLQVTMHVVVVIESRVMSMMALKLMLSTKWNPIKSELYEHAYLLGTLQSTSLRVYLVSW